MIPQNLPASTEKASPSNPGPSDSAKKVAPFNEISSIYTRPIMHMYIYIYTRSPELHMYNIYTKQARNSFAEDKASEVEGFIIYVHVCECV